MYFIIQMITCYLLNLTFYENLAYEFLVKANPCSDPITPDNVHISLTFYHSQTYGYGPNLPSRH